MATGLIQPLVRVLHLGLPRVPPMGTYVFCIAGGLLIHFFNLYRIKLSLINLIAVSLRGVCLFDHFSLRDHYLLHRSNLRLKGLGLWILVLFSLRLKALGLWTLALDDLRLKFLILIILRLKYLTLVILNI